MEKFPENVSVAVFAAALMPGPNLSFAALSKEFARRFGWSRSEGSEEKLPTTEEFAWHDRLEYSLLQLSPPEVFSQASLIFLSILLVSIYRNILKSMKRDQKGCPKVAGTFPYTKKWLYHAHP